MMSEVVGSAIVEEAVNRIFSGIISKYEDDPDEEDSIERLEMAHVKMEAAVQTSRRWQITDSSLLQWRKKLKRAAQECDDTLRRCKQRALKEEEIKQQVRQSSLPRRVAHATKSLISSLIGHNDDEPNMAMVAVRRFERIADGANDFLRYVQLGGTPRRYMFFDPLIGHLFAGKSVQYEMLHHGSQFYYFGIRPMSFEERGLEAMIAFIYEDSNVPENSFRLGSILRLSESTDIIGITVKCLQLVTPHFKSTAEVVIKELTQLPTQDFTCSQPYDSHGIEHWNSVHNTLTQWFRPDPLCCKGYGHDVPACTSRANGPRLSEIFPEPLCELFLQRHISLSEYSNLQGLESSSLEDLTPWKLEVLFVPHDCVDDHQNSAMGAESFAVEAIDGEKQQHSHADVHPDQLDEMLLPKAIHHLYSNSEVRTYQISWKSKHGSAHLCVGKTSMQMRRKHRSTMRPVRDRIKVCQTQGGLGKGQWRQLGSDCLKSLQKVWLNR
ncbi:hypothetical protein ACP4OV_020709 [Aristida adscensionis]